MATFKFSKLKFVRYTGPDSIKSGRVPRVFLDCPREVAYGTDYQEVFSCEEVLYITKINSDYYVYFKEPNLHLSIQELEILLYFRERYLGEKFTKFYYKSNIVDQLYRINDTISRKINAYYSVRTALNRYKDSVENLRNNVYSAEQSMLFLKNIHFSGKEFNPIVEYEFHDVIAEDVRCVGEDINLGSLKYEVNILSSEVRLVEGSELRNGYENREVYHPHQTHSDGNICLGSQTADFSQAISEGKLDIVEAILSKFSHSYVSDDPAGKYYVEWTDDPIERVYVETRDSYYPITDCREVDGEWYHDDDLRYMNISDSYAHEDDVVWSDYHDSYILIEESFEYDDEWYLNEIAIYTEEGIDIPSFMEEEYVEIDDSYYLTKNTVEDYKGERILKATSHYNSEHNIYMSADDPDIVHYKDEYIPLSYLPEEVKSQLELD